MSEMKLVKTRLTAGIWEGELRLSETSEIVPEIEVTHLDQPLPGHSLTEDPERAGVFLFRFAIPADLINDGVETFLFTESTTGETLGSCVILAGEALAEDIRAEMDLIRAELDMLKRAFRRHCIDTGAT